MQPKLELTLPKPRNDRLERALFALLGNHLKAAPFNEVHVCRDMTLGQWRKKLAAALQAADG